MLTAIASTIPWRLLPQVELVRFKNIDFFAPPPKLDSLQSICIATKTRTIGDALALSTLPRKLKALYPHLRITTYPRSFNPVVFAHNPYVSSVDYLPKAVYGDDCSLDGGHLIQLKEHYFGVPADADPKPEIYLTQSERDWAAEWAASSSGGDKPICILHPWGHTWQNVAPAEYWDELVATHRDRWSFWQVGIEGHALIPGCDRAYLSPRGFWRARRLFALTERAQAFIGVNSGPMHIAKAFGIKSLILTEEGDVAGIFARRKAAPYYLHKNFAHAFLYSANRHINFPSLGLDSAIRESGDFLAKP